MNKIYGKYKSLCAIAQKKLCLEILKIFGYDILYL